MLCFAPEAKQLKISVARGVDAAMYCIDKTDSKYVSIVHVADTGQRLADG